MKYNKAEQQAKVLYEKKLKEEPTDGSLSSKDWLFKVNTLSGIQTDIPVLKNGDQVYITAKEKAELFSQIFAKKYHLDSADEIAPAVPQSTQHTIAKITFKTKDVHKLLL